MPPPSPHGSGPSDEMLMGRVQNGETDAFAVLYDRHAERAFRVAQATCDDAGRAEEAVREGFRTIWRGRAQYGPENGSFKAWAMGIVSKQAIDSESTLEQVIALAYFGGLSHAEIAAQLELPAGDVKGRMRLGLEKLRKRSG